MRKIFSAISAITLLLCVTSKGSAVTDDQFSQENNVARTAKQRSANEKMMPSPDEQLKRLTKGLILTTEQQKQIKPVLIDEFAKLKDLRNDENLGPKQIQKKVEELRSEAVTKIKTYLSPDQIEKLDLVSREIKANKHKRIKENRKERIGAQSDPLPQQTKQ